MALLLAYILIILICFVNLFFKIFPHFPSLLFASSVMHRILGLAFAKQIKHCRRSPFEPLRSTDLRHEKFKFAIFLWECHFPLIANVAKSPFSTLLCLAVLFAFCPSQIAQYFVYAARQAPVLINKSSTQLVKRMPKRFWCCKMWERVILSDCGI